jgi:hypothetical protein
MKVVRILDEFRVIIDYGYKHGAKEDDILTIKSKIGIPIHDCDTHEYLGTYFNEKATISLSVIYDNMSICVNTKTSIYYERLNVSHTQISCCDNDKIINLCDPVYLIDKNRKYIV